MCIWDKMNYLEAVGEILNPVEYRHCMVEALHSWVGGVGEDEDFPVYYRRLCAGYPGIKSGWETSQLVACPECLELLYG